MVSWFIYLDNSPLENYHVSQAFKVMMKKEFNILVKFSSAEFRLIRKRIIECILATDMTYHSKIITNLKNKISLAGVVEGQNIQKLIEDIDVSKKFDNQQLILSNIIHAADISNPIKLPTIYRKWVDRVFIEFFNQGDLEKKENLPISLLCDRATTEICKAQVGFIKFVVRPTFEILKVLVPEIQTYFDYMNRNLKMYEDESNNTKKDK